MIYDITNKKFKKRKHFIVKEQILHEENFKLSYFDFWSVRFRKPFESEHRYSTFENYQRRSRRISIRDRLFVFGVNKKK